MCSNFVESDGLCPVLKDFYHGVECGLIWMTIMEGGMFNLCVEQV